MSIFLDIEDSIPVPPAHDKEARADMFEKARAAANAIDLLEKHGLADEPLDNKQDMYKAGGWATEYAENPEKASESFVAKEIAAMPPPALKLTYQILQDFGHSIVHSSVQVRHMVVNKLIQETENPDPRIRVRALELLGKMSDVGLFTERSEVTVTHQTSDELRAQLKARLGRLKNVTPAAQALDAPPAAEEAEIVEDDDD